MDGLIALAIIIYAVSYIAGKSTAKRPRRAAPQRKHRTQTQEYHPQEQEPALCMHDDPDTFRPAAPFKEAYSGSLSYRSTEGIGTESVPCSLTEHDHPDVHADAHPDLHAGIPSQEEPARPFLSAADRNACKRAVIYAEILGKPRALRR